MKQIAVVTVLMVGGILAWLFASRLSADALGMAVGLLFGVLAGVPTALLVLASGRRRALIMTRKTTKRRHRAMDKVAMVTRARPAFSLSAPGNCAGRATSSTCPTVAASTDRRQRWLSGAPGASWPRRSCRIGWPRVQSGGRKRGIPRRMVEDTPAGK